MSILDLSVGSGDGDISGVRIGRKDWGCHGVLDLASRTSLLDARLFDLFIGDQNPMI